MSKWYVICTRKGWEKKAERLLFERGFQSYCPMRETKRKWSDRVKTVAAPLFNSHIFVRMRDEQRSAVRMTPGVINFVYTKGRPATIKKTEMDALQQLLANGGIIEVFPLNRTGPVSDEEPPVKERQNGSGLRVKKTKIQIGENSYEVRAASPRLISAPTANTLQ